MSMRERLVKGDFGPSRTKQEFLAEADVNLIMKRFKKVAGVDFLNKYQGFFGGQFGDFSQVTDYRTALHQVNQAEKVFDALPAKVRARFENDAAQFLDFMGDPKNVDEIVAMGLAKPKSQVEKPVAPPVKV